MKEESLAEDMRAALRGDRERAEQARQRSTENVLGLLDVSVREPEPPAPEPEGKSRRFGRLFGR